MTKRNRILLRIVASVLGVIALLVITSVLIFQSSWFANFVRGKIVSTIEESTGGVAEIGSFQFDWTHLTVRIRNFVLHGTEPKGSGPLARVALLEVHLKLFSALKQAVDISYLGIEQPRVNLIVFPNGTTNIPQPTVVTKPSQTSGLQTVVDLAVGQFEIKNGLLQAAQQKSAFSARGENLRALLNYNALTPSYQGFLAIDPLLLTSGQQPPLNVHVNLPITLEKDAIRLTNAKLNTDQSQILLTASLQNLNEPQIAGQLHASISLPEMQRALNLPIDTNKKGAPKNLTAEANLSVDGKTNAVQVQDAHLAMGDTTFEASGTLDSAANKTVQFNGSFALAQLSALLKVSGVQPSGTLQANGNAKLDRQNNYLVDGTLSSKGISVRSGSTRLSDVSLSSPFHADPFLISLDGLKLHTFGGDLAAKVFVEKMQNLSVEGTLHNFSLPILARSLTGKTLGYDGALDGSVKAAGDLNAKGTTGYTAQARLAIVPGRRGVPVSGRLLADYNGRTGAINVGQSYIALPNSRLDLSGSLNRRIDLNLVSHNLNDFLPAATFGAVKPQDSLPVTLRGGTADVTAQITGNLAAPHITSHVALSRFAVEQRFFDQFAADLTASPSGAIVQNGSLSSKALRTNFDASIGLRKWSPTPESPLIANVSLRNGDLADLLALAGESSIPATGELTGDVHVNGTYGNPLGSATLQVLNGSAYNQPIDKLYTNVILGDQLITLSTLELDAAGGRLSANGTFRHPRDSFTVGHAQFHVATTGVQLANIQPLEKQSPGVAGLIQLTADAAADVREVNKQSEVTVSNITADLSARGLKLQNQNAGDLTATARTNNGNVTYDVASNFAGSTVKVTGSTALSKDYTTAADAHIQNLPVEKVLSIVGQGAVPARGTLSADAHVNGTLQAPNANVSFDLDRANVYGEPINRLQGALRYANTLVDIPSIRLDAPAGSLTLTGSFSHPANDFNAGALALKLNSSEIDVSKVRHAEQAKPGLAGTLRLAADLSANMRNEKGPGAFRISRLNADASANDLRIGTRTLEALTFKATTTDGRLNYHLDSDLAKSQIRLTGNSQLSGDYVTSANLTFSGVRYLNLAPFIESDPAVKPLFDAFVDGEASVNGPLLNTDALNGRLQLTRLEATTSPQSSATGGPPTRKVDFHNDGPITIALNRSQIQILRLRITGPGTTIDASGGLNLKNASNPISLNVNADADLGVLQDVDRDFYSSGAIALNATLHGSFAQPLVNGKLELKNANVNYSLSPNGLSNANGVILLNGTNANIENLTGESGGGKIALSGFVGLSGDSPSFNLRATAKRVRVRYSGVSVTSDAAVILAGNVKRSLVSGTVTVQRIAYGASSDVGSLLSGASTPPETPTAPSPLFAGMRLDVKILTAPDLRVITTYANRLAVEANLNVRGTGATPGILGHITVTDGQLVFFGNTYTVNTGAINFYNPNAIIPVLNVSLETIAQNVDVTLGVTGPINNMQLSYRSDPPLTFEQIVQLLATNTTPADPTIAAHQPNPQQQSLSQMGESAVLGQAVANPLASRVQRVFGISQFKIDPSFSGGGQASARVTLQQKIASNITFTYITDVTQTNSEIIKIEWAFTPALSFVGLRDFNGNVSVEMYYKFKVR